MFNSYYEKIGEKTICIDDELPFTIPSSWRWVRLNWIAKFASGKTPSMGNRNYYGNYIPWITSKDMKLKYIAESQIKLSSLGAEQMQIFDPQTLLLVTRSGILRHSIPIAILHNYATINQDLKAITLYYADLAEYIYLCIKGFEKFILTNYTKSGTTVESLVFERFQKILIPLPPEKEARLITERCDTLIKHIDKLSANYVSLKENIEILKCRILDIFFGENCRYKSYYEYEENCLSNIATLITKGSTPTTYGFEYLSEGINFIKVENVKDYCVQHNTIKQFISEAAHEFQKRSQLKKDDLLISIAGTIGRICLIKNEDLPANTNQAFAIVRGYTQTLLPDYLKWFVTWYVDSKSQQLGHGGGMDNLTLREIKALRIKYPVSKDDQQQIIDKINACLEIVSAIDGVK